MYEKYGCEVEITRTEGLRKIITETFQEKIRFNLPYVFMDHP